MLTPPLSPERACSELAHHGCDIDQDSSFTEPRAISTSPPRCSIFTPASDSPKSWATGTQTPNKRMPISDVFTTFTPPPSTSTVRLQDDRFPTIDFKGIPPLGPRLPIDITGSRRSNATYRQSSPRGHGRLACRVQVTSEVSQRPRLVIPLRNLDGCYEAPSEDSSPTGSASRTNTPETPSSTRSLPGSDQATDYDEPPTLNATENGQRLAGGTLGHTLPSALATPFDQFTPLTRASPAKGAFPFLIHNTAGSLNPLAARRLASAMLQPGSTRSCQTASKATSQRSDRYIPNRDLNAQFRETYLLSTPPEELRDAERRDRKQSPNLDPFCRNPTVTPRRLNTRTAVQARTPQQSRLTLPRPSRVQANGRVPRTSRAVSQGAVWNVGGSDAVTDGVTSITDGHGGRMASGTNAPMYSSAFLDQSEPLNEKDMYTRRLAAACEVDQAHRILASSANIPTLVVSPASPGSSPTSSPGSPTFWADNE